MTSCGTLFQEHQYFLVIHSLLPQRGEDRHSVEHQQKAKGLRVAQLLLGQGEQETLHHRRLRQDERRLSHRSQRDTAQNEGAQALTRSASLPHPPFAEHSLIYINIRLLICVFTGCFQENRGRSPCRWTPALESWIPTRSPGRKAGKVCRVLCSVPLFKTWQR